VPPIGLLLQGTTGGNGRATVTFTVPDDIEAGTWTIQSVVLPTNDVSMTTAVDVEITACTEATWFADADGDGFGDVDDAVTACEMPDGYVANPYDCDDAEVDVHPGAREACDSVDNDCDTLVDDDDDSVFGDTLTFADADGDGFGDVGTFYLSCTAPDGAVTNALDCDDAEDAAYYGATEVCDGIDNDCDAAVDEDQVAVPATYATIQEAIDAGETSVCIAAGTYEETLSITEAGASVELRGVDAETVILQGDGTGTIVDAGAGVTWVGLTSLTVQGGGGEAGGGIYAAADTVELTDVIVQDNAVSGDAAYGGGIYVDDDCSLLVTSSHFEGNAASSGVDARGGAIYSQGSVDVLDSSFVGSSLAALAADASLYGADIAGDGLSLSTTTFSDTQVTADDYATVDGGSVYSGSSLSISEVAWSGVSLALTAGTDIDGGALFFRRGTVSDVSFQDVSVDVSGGDARVDGGALYLQSNNSAYLYDAEITDTVVTIAGDASYVLGGAAYLSTDATDTTEVSGLSITGTSVTDTSTDAAEVYGGALYHGSQVQNVDDVDVRDTTVFSDVIYGGAARLSTSMGDEASSYGIVVAGATIGDASTSEVYGGGLSIAGGITLHFQLRDVDVYGVDVDAAAVYGAGVHVASSGTVTLRNANVSGITSTDTTAVVAFADDSSGTCNLVYSNLYDTTLTATSGWATETSLLFADPLYTDVSGTDPTAWDLTLQAGSPSVDAGDPSFTDEDGTTSDIGALGL
jgi:hypothetical protein